MPKKSERKRIQEILDDFCVNYSKSDLERILKIEDDRVREMEVSKIIKERLK